MDSPKVQYNIQAIDGPRDGGFYLRADVDAYIAELEEHLKSARNDGFDMCKADYREQFAEYDERITELEEQLMFFLEDWDHCTELGFCPEMGYLKEDWCPWCKTRRLLGLSDARNWEEHLENET